MNGTQTRPAAARSAGSARRRRRGTHRILAFFVILLALALFAVFALFIRAVLSGEWPSAASKKIDEPAAAVLDDAWTAKLAACTTQQQMKDTIDAAVEGAASLRCTALAWTARAADGTAFFRDGTKTLRAAAAVTDSDRFLSRFDPLQYLVRRAAKSGLAVYLIATGDDGAPLTAADLAALPAWETALAQKHGLTVLAPAAADGTVAVSSYAASEGAALLRADSDPALLASAKQTEGETKYGVVLGDYTALAADSTQAALYFHFLEGGALPDLTQYWNGKTIARTLAVTYPKEDNSAVSDEAIFLMGTSDPAAALTLNGTTVPRYGSEGVWGMLVTLQTGANTFALQNGSASLTYTVNREQPADTGTATPKADGTPGREAIGQKVQITEDIASALGDYGSSSSIHETLYKGALAEITGVASYTAGTRITHAYRLSTGDYIRASSCTVSDAPDAAFAGCTVSTDDAARATVLTFAGGTPAVYHTWENGTLTLTFLSASCTGAAPAADGSFLTGASIENGAGQFTLTLTFAQNEPLCGWTVNYDTAANTTSIWLKRTPHLSTDAGAPLAGVTILLDPGHGGDAEGAMGAAGVSAPEEKELNLSVAYAAKYRLEQLGATVTLTRQDDTNPSLGDRVTALNTQHPDYFIAIHHNSVELTADVNQSTGTEAYWFYEEGKPLADNLVAAVCGATGRANRGSAYDYYYVTRSDICPATLLELGFVTNPAEYETCTDPAVIWAEGSAIAEGIYRTVSANG